MQVTFVYMLTTPRRRIYVYCNLEDNTYVMDSYIPILQSLSVLNEDATDVTFENPIYHRVGDGIGQRHHRRHHRRHHPRGWWWCWISTIAYISVLLMKVAPHVHRHFGYVPPWRKSLGGVSLSPRETHRIFRFAVNVTIIECIVLNKRTKSC